MNQQLANIALQFLSRTQLKGDEVPAFNAVMAALSDIANPQQAEPVIDQPKPESVLAED